MSGRYGIQASINVLSTPEEFDSTALTLDNFDRKFTTEVVHW